LARHVDLAAQTARHVCAKTLRDPVGSESAEGVEAPHGWAMEPGFGQRISHARRITAGMYPCVCWRGSPNLEIIALTGPGPIATDGPIEWADVSANRRNIYSILVWN
jgi:hypothetical protein